MKNRIISALILIVLFIGIIFLLAGCDSKKTKGIENIKIGKLPKECQLYFFTVDAVKNNDGGGITKNKQAEKNFTIAAFWAAPCLAAIKDMKLDEKQKLLDKIRKLKTENEKLKIKLEFLQKELSKK